MGTSYGSEREVDQGGDGVRLGGARGQRSDQGLGDGADQGGGGDLRVLRGKQATRHAGGDGGRDQVPVGAPEHQALGVDGRMNGIDLFDPASPLRLEPGRPVKSFLAGPRVGLSKDRAPDTPWRFVDAEMLEWSSTPRLRAAP